MKKIRCETCGGIITGRPIISPIDDKTKQCHYCADLEVQGLLRGNIIGFYARKRKKHG